MTENVRKTANLLYKLSYKKITFSLTSEDNLNGQAKRAAPRYRERAHVM